jgi:carboxyl-terminal processing protease
MRISRLGTISLLVLALCTIAGGWLGDRVLAGGGRLGEHLRLYTAIISTIEEHYVEDVEADRLVSSSIRELLRTLDPHSNFLEMREFSSLQERQKGSYYGLGITVQSIDGNITVVAPFEGTPAFRLGIRAGDIISHIEGEDARGLPIDDAVKRLRGPKGSPVSISVVRQGYDDPLEFTVIRDEIPLHSVPYSFMVGENTGYIRLTDFNETTACSPGEGPECEKELEAALRRLTDQGAEAMILDIRDNPGGLLNQAFAVSNLFLEKGDLVVYTKGRHKRDESSYRTEADSPWTDLPLVVLVSRHSASASEIVAGAIQDHDRGLIVGETTFGKGLVQTIMELRNVRGYALALTTARYYTPSGRSIQRDYASLALEDYVVPQDRHGCDTHNGGETELTAAGRTVYGGDGIRPDYCVPRATPSRLVASLITRQAVMGFARTFEARRTQGEAEIEGAGSRSKVAIEGIRIIDSDFEVGEETFEQFRGYIAEQGIEVEAEELNEHRDEILRVVEEEIIRQVFGEGEARRRTAKWDPQVRKALEVVQMSALLLEDPGAFIKEREAELRVASAAEHDDAAQQQ